MTNISFQGSVSKGWLHQNGGFRFDEKYYTDPLYRRQQDSEINDFVRSVFHDYPVYNMEANLLQAAFVEENQVLVGGIQPNLILAIILGADFIAYPDKDADVSGHPLMYISSAEALPGKSQILGHPFIKNLDNQITELQKNHPGYVVIPPFFWDTSGRATIHGIITTSFKLIGDRAMMMTMIEPDLLHAVHQWVADTYMLLINHYSALGDIPVTSVHVGECSGAMISGEQYREFIVPYVSELGAAFGGIRLHSCGHSDHLLEAINSIENLKIIDTGSGTSVAKIRAIAGEEMEINLEPPVKLMLSGVPRSGMLTWLDKVLEENRGGPLKIAFHLEADYSMENCLMIYDELVSRKLIEK